MNKQIPFPYSNLQNYLTNYHHDIEISNSIYIKSKNFNKIPTCPYLEKEPKKTYFDQKEKYRYEIKDKSEIFLNEIPNPKELNFKIF